jgi:dolichol-phosphate mannosyltransferase
MELSVVIPVRNEAGNIAPLVAEIAAALDGLAAYEIVYVDDGSSDATAEEIRRLQRDQPQLRLLRHRACCGQSTAIRSGVKAARGRWIATLDGDGQNDPADIARLWPMALAEPAAGRQLLIAGQRARRRDSWSKRQASRLANAVRRGLLHDDTPDTGCGLKLFPRALFLDLPYFNHMHRFLPALVLRAGGTVRSVPVNHRPRRRGRSNYGIWDRLWVGIVDLFGVMWLCRRAAMPVLVEDDTVAEEREKEPEPLRPPLPAELPAPNAAALAATASQPAAAV